MVNPRSEPVLWVQLISLGALPLEVLLLLVLLAGADPGPLPLLERLLAWALGALGPALLLWRRPADVRSLLLLTSASATATPQQRQLASLQTGAVPRLLFAAGVVALLPLLSWLDSTAALASPYSPLQHAGRLSSLMLAAALLALMVWQWQQLVQAAWLLSRSPAQLAATEPLSAAALNQERSNFGMPLLLLRPLELPQPVAKAERSHDSKADPLFQHEPEPDQPDLPTPGPAAEPSAAIGTGGQDQEAPTQTLADPEEPLASLASSDVDAAEPLDVAVTVEPEQSTEDNNGGELDQHIG